MPRTARVKTNSSIFHIMVRSIKEVPLFKEDKDKERYMNILRGYQKIYGFKVYAYCLMTNHGHFIIDVNGADISKIMHSINFKYARVFNTKYNRYGHLFQDRFKSEIVDNQNYLVTLSAYIHNNPLDMKKYRENPEKYRFSSLSVYLGFKKDPFEVVDEDFVMQLFGKDVESARKSYYGFVFRCNNKKRKEEVEFTEPKTFYKSERHILIRNFSPEDVVDFVAEKTGVDRTRFRWKHRKDAVESRALSVLLMRSLCNYRCSDICVFLGNITQSRVSKLCGVGFRLMEEDERYRDILEEFVKKHSA